jgi:hypothetical protein
MNTLLGQVTDAIDGFLNSPLVRLFVLGFVAYVVLVWLASAWWVLNDLRRRHAGLTLPYVAAGSVIVSSPLLFPLAVAIYRIVRPKETLAEVNERVLTERLEALEIEEARTCPGCAEPVEDGWLGCPECRTRLGHRCATCGQTMGLDWVVCGWCGEELEPGVEPDRLPRAVRRASRASRRARVLPEAASLAARPAERPAETGAWGG